MDTVGKVCTRCKQLLPLSSFSIKDKKSGTLKSWCKPCLAADSIRRYHANPEAHKAQSIAWMKAHPEKLKIIQRRTQEKNRDRIRQRQRDTYWKRRDKKKAYRAANAERIKARNAEYRADHEAQIKAYGHAYYRANAEVVAERVRKCVAAKPDLYFQLHKAAKHRRKVRLENCGPVEKFTDLEIFNRDGWTCHLCGGVVDASLAHPHPMSASLDHIKPIANGGGHTRDNVALAHLRCNLAKRNLYERRAE